MNKKIKFRGFDKELNCFYGIPFFSHGTGIWSITYSDDWFPSYHNPDQGETTLYTPINPSTIQQFTGIKDKNGTELYEGDIIDLHQTINGCSRFIIEWSQKRKGWTLRYAQNMVNPRTYEYDVADVFTIEELEVIGNIHQNPELLTT